MWESLLSARGCSTPVASQYMIPADIGYSLFEDRGGPWYSCMGCDLLGYGLMPMQVGSELCDMIRGSTVSGASLSNGRTWTQAVPPSTSISQQVQQIPPSQHSHPHGSLLGFNVLLSIFVRRHRQSTISSIFWPRIIDIRLLILRFPASNPPAVKTLHSFSSVNRSP